MLRYDWSLACNIVKFSRGTRKDLGLEGDGGDQWYWRGDLEIVHTSGKILATPLMWFLSQSFFKVEYERVLLFKCNPCRD